LAIDLRLHYQISLSLEARPPTERGRLLFATCVNVSRGNDHGSSTSQDSPLRSYGCSFGDFPAHRAFLSGEERSLDVTEACIERILDPQGRANEYYQGLGRQGACCCKCPGRVDAGLGYASSPIVGVPISIKDMLDVKGETTLAGSKALDDAAPAAEDSPVVRRLKAAGAVLVGRTNMAQFAFSIVGLNPHFGTPGNPWDRSRIPGGSSSGAAVSVADGMATAAIGSDTVGSIRAPAALCGVVGFKPTQRSVPRQGAIPLSITLDTIGPLARTVEDCALVYGGHRRGAAAFSASGRARRLEARRTANKSARRPRSRSFRAFERACSAISRANASLVDTEFKYFEEIESKKCLRRDRICGRAGMAQGSPDASRS